MDNKHDLYGLLYRSDAQGIDIKTKLPSDFTSVIVKARRHNAEENITSLLFYYREKYIHYVEGPKQSVSNLIDSVRVDDRHANIEVLFHLPIKLRFIEGSPLKLSSANGDIHQGFARFVFGEMQLDSSSIKDNGTLLNKLMSLESKSSETNNQKVLKSSIQASTVSSSDSQKNGFSQYLIGMNKWPNFTQEDVNSGLLQLCALLVSKKVSYQSLQAANPFVGDKELDAALTRLQSMSLLEMTLNESVQQEEKVVKKGFFSKVQKFIKRLQQ